MNISSYNHCLVHIMSFLWLSSRISLWVLELSQRLQLLHYASVVSGFIQIQLLVLFLDVSFAKFGVDIVLLSRVCLKINAREVVIFDQSWL
jgi:hypothetical protein